MRIKALFMTMFLLSALSEWRHWNTLCILSQSLPLSLCHLELHPVTPPTISYRIVWLSLMRTLNYLRISNPMSRQNQVNPSKRHNSLTSCLSNLHGTSFLLDPQSMTSTRSRLIGEPCPTRVYSRIASIDRPVCNINTPPHGYLALKMPRCRFDLA